MGSSSRKEPNPSVQVRNFLVAYWETSALSLSMSEFQHLLSFAVMSVWDWKWPKCQDTQATKNKARMKGEKHAANSYVIPFTRLGGTCPWLGVAQSNRGEPVTAVWLRIEFKRGTNEHFAHPSKAFQKKKKRKEKSQKLTHHFGQETLQ